MPSRPLSLLETVLCYLDKPEIDALLAAADRTIEQGRRDHSVLLFLYNTGALASESAAVAIRDLDVRSDGSGSVRLVGEVARRDTVRFGPRPSRRCGR
jgi:integrase/recombinase XerD